jgi:hypothetical protein
MLKHVYLKPVIKQRDMDDDMLRNIEGWAKETLEETKVKYKDEMVIYHNLYHILIC